LLLYYYHHPLNLLITLTWPFGEISSPPPPKIHIGIAYFKQLRRWYSCAAKKKVASKVSSLLVCGFHSSFIGGAVCLIMMRRGAKMEGIGNARGNASCRVGLGLVTVTPILLIFLLPQKEGFARLTCIPTAMN